MSADSDAVGRGPKRGSGSGSGSGPREELEVEIRGSRFEVREITHSRAISGSEDPGVFRSGTRWRLRITRAWRRIGPGR